MTNLNVDEIVFEQDFRKLLEDIKNDKQEVEKFQIGFQKILNNIELSGLSKKDQLKIIFNFDCILNEWMKKCLEE